MSKLVYQVQGILEEEIVFIDNRIFADYDECCRRAEKLDKDGFDGMDMDDIGKVQYYVVPMKYVGYKEK